MLKVLSKVLLLVSLYYSFTVYAAVYPVVINTEYKPGGWQPLPAEKIKQAAAFSALQEISASKRFAFFKNKPKGISAGILHITISLVEEAEIVTVNISLSVPGQATLYSTHSASLANQYYDGIYRQFQHTGTEAGKKIVKQYLKKYSANKINTNDKRYIFEINRLNNELIQINKRIINQSAGSNSLQIESKLKIIVKDLDKIDRLTAALEKQDTKLDTIIDEVGQINQKIDQTPRTQVNINQKYILENALSGQNSIPGSEEKGLDEHKAQELYNRAQKYKRNSKYQKAEQLLKQAIDLRISAGLRALISDELFYQLPMFEAQAIAIDLGRNFQKYSSQNLHKQKLNRIRKLYEFALDNNQNNFERMSKIQQALDQHINTSRAMSATLSVQSRSNLRIVHQYMEQYMMTRGKYPDKKEFQRILRDVRQPHKLISYKAGGYEYSAKLRAPDGRVVELMNDRNGIVIKE